MIGMQVAATERKGHRLIRRTLNLTRAEHPGRIAIEQQAQQHSGGIRFPPARSIVGIQRREIKLGHAIYHEARQMVGRQTVAQPYRQIECLVIVHFFEGSTHTQQYSMTDERHQFLSDKLLGASIPNRGLMPPGKEVTSLGVDGKTLTFGGTSVAAPFVTGAIALLWSEFPTATGAEVKFVATQAYTARRTTIVPPLLDAWAGHQMMTTYGRK